MEKRGRGAPTKLTKQVHEKIINFLRGGAYAETAAAAAGICKDTFYDWLKKAAKQKKGIYRDFSDAVERATAESQMRDLSVVDKAAQAGQWKAAAWRLEHRHPKQWGSRQTLEHLRPDQQPVSLSQLSEEELDTELKRLSDANDFCS